MLTFVWLLRLTFLVRSIIPMFRDVIMELFISDKKIMLSLQQHIEVLAYIPTKTIRLLIVISLFVFSQ